MFYHLSGLTAGGGFLPSTVSKNADYPLRTIVTR